MNDIKKSNSKEIGEKIEIFVNPTWVSDDFIVDFVKKCFEVPRKQGITFPACHIDSDFVKKIRASGAVVVAQIGPDVVACSLVVFQRCGFLLSKQRMNISVDCVDPAFSRMGISSKLTSFVLEMAEEKKCSYAYLSTSLDSSININRRLKNGFYRWRINSYIGTNYYSILFRKNFYNDKFYRLWHLFRYKYSYRWCRMCKRADGSHTMIGAVVEKPLLAVRSAILSALKRICHAKKT